MNKKTYQIISLILIFILIFLSLDTSTLAMEPSMREEHESNIINYKTEESPEEAEVETITGANHDTTETQDKLPTAKINDTDDSEAAIEIISENESQTNSTKNEEILSEIETMTLDETKENLSEIETVTLEETNSNDEAKENLSEIETVTLEEKNLNDETKENSYNLEKSFEHIKSNTTIEVIFEDNNTINNNSLENLLNSYFSLLGYGFTEYDEALFLKCMSQEVFDNMIRRLGILDEAQKVINAVSYEVTEYDEENGELLINVAETINGNTVETLHTMSVSHNNESNWHINSDLYDDTDISGIRTDGKEISLYSYSTGYPNTWSNTGDQAKDIAQIALTQVGYTETNENHTKYNAWYYGSDTSAQWCAIFISWCANQAGISKSVIKPNAWAGYTMSGMSQNGYNVPAYSFSSTSAKVGDIAFINNDTDSKSDHVGLIYAVDANYIYTVEGNYSNKVSKCKYSTSSGCMVSPKNTSSVNIMFYGRPHYSNSSQNNVSPIGHLDGIEGGKGTITAIGWAADPDDYSKDVDIHIYVGGNIGVGSLYSVTANNASRSDVKNEHPDVKENCGFNYTFKVNERGTQEVYVYALDTQGTSLNTLIGHTTITIANPDPVIRISPDSLQLNVNDTKPLTVSFEISETYKLNFHIPDANIASAEWGTPANGKCDLTVKGLKKGDTTIDIQLWNEAMTTLIYKETIPLTVTELSVEFSEDIVETNENETKTFEFHFTGSDLYGLECDIGDRSIADLTGWEWNENNDGTIKVQGYKEGTTNLTVHLMGGNNTILFSQSVPITVTKPSASFGQNRMDINVNNTKEITFSFKGSNLQDIGLDIADQSIASLEGWFWDENNNGTIRIKGHKKGTTTMTLYLIGADGTHICSKSIPIYVNSNLTGITLNTYSKELTVGESFQLAVSYTPSDAKPEGNVQWSSSNTHIVVVDARGRIKAVKAGSAIITAVVDGYSKTCRVTVIEEESSDTGTPSETEESSITESTREPETTTENASESEETTKPEEESSESKEEFSKPEKESSESEESSVTQNSENTETTTENASESEETTRPEEESSESKEESSEPEEEITNEISIKPIEDIVYTGMALKPELDVYNGSKKLLLNKDYTVSYKNNVAAGTAYAIVKGKGNYSDKVTTSFNILPKDLSDIDVIAEDLALAVNHKVQKKIPAVSYNGKKLKANKDFKVTFGDGDFAEKGTYIVTLTGMNNYTGNIQAKIILTDKKNLIKNAKVTYLSSHPYTGKEITPPVTVMCNNNILTNGKDYTISYINNINPGKGTIVITGKGSYAGTKTVKLTITKARTVLIDQMVDIKSSMAYVKGGCTPEPLVICNGKTLVMGRDYTVSYKNNKSVGIATLSVKGKGTYSGTVEKSFKIKQQNINNISVRVPDVAYNEKSGKYISTPILMDSDGSVLKQNKDYGIVSYTLNETPLNNQSQPATDSTITVTLSGIGNYTGTVIQTYKLKKMNFSKAKVSGIRKTYTGSAVTIAPSDLYVTLNGETLVYGKDYTIVKGTYKNNMKKGQASVVIKGLGEFAGEKTVKFRITARPINY